MLWRTDFPKNLKVIDKGRSDKRKLTSGNLKSLIPTQTTHQRYADVFRGLGFDLKLSKDSCLPPKDVSPRILSFIGKHQKKAIGIAPFAAYESKMYSLDKMKEVVKKLDNSEQYSIFLFGGGAKEEEVLSQWEQYFKHVRNVAGQLTFQEELILISNLDLMLSMDSSNGHLAAIYNVPVVTIWGVTHPATGFAPFMQEELNSLIADRSKYPLIPTSVYGNKYPDNYASAADSISVEDVVAMITSIID